MTWERPRPRTCPARVIIDQLGRIGAGGTIRDAEVFTRG
jgi:hypothetical protein